jgi:hypothetical protein
MNKLFAAGGVAASVILIAFGIGTIVVALVGRADVRDAIEREQITGSPDMNPEATEAALREANLDVEVPSCTAAGVEVRTGSEAKCFADYMRIHTLEATGGQTYSQMPRFLGEDGEPTPDEEEAAVDPESGEPVSNPQREIWVTETALATALNTSYFAERVSLFSLIVGIALLLSGIGFLVLTVGLRRREAERVATATGQAR